MTENKEPTPSKNVVMFIAALASFLTPFMASSINTALKAMGSEFGVGTIYLSWIATSYILAAAVFLVPFGRLADIYGRKRLFIIGMITYSLASLLIGLSTSAGMVIAFRVLQGIGGSMMFGTGIAILTSVFPPHERGKALGINTAAVYLGLSLGPFVGGVLTEHMGWRYIFFLNVPAGIIVLLLTFWKLKGEWAGARGERFDLTGSLIYGGGVVSAMYGFTRLPDLLGIGLFTLGLLALAGFVLWELRVKSPVLDIDLFRKNQVFAFSNLAALVNYLGSSSIAFLLSLYLLYVKGLPPTLAGLVLIAQPIIMAVFSPIAGRLSDRFEPRVVASIGMGITALGLFFLVFVDDLKSVFYIIDCLLVLGFGLALFSSPNTNAIMGSVERRSFGVASATLATMRLSGQMLSMSLATLILAIYIGHAQITEQNQGEFITAMRLAFGISAALCVAGIFFSLRRGKMHAISNNDQG